jgi:hypothetical protein
MATAEKGCDRNETRVIDVGVVLTRVLDDVDVEGQGGSIVMYLNRSRVRTGPRSSFKRADRISRHPSTLSQLFLGQAGRLTRCAQALAEGERRQPTLARGPPCHLPKTNHQAWLQEVCEACWSSSTDGRPPAGSTSRAEACAYVACRPSDTS